MSPGGTDHLGLSVPDASVLDHPVWETLRGNHSRLARRVGDAATFQTGVSTFVAVDGDDPRRWDDLAQLLGPGELADMFSATDRPPANWDHEFTLDGRQMIFTGPPPAYDTGHGTGTIVELGSESLPEMLDLVERTRPGPFGPRTPELGTYLGVRRDGVLIAMAGERLRPPGWTEVSAVCTAPEARGQGHSARLVNELVARTLDRGERALLHVIDTNARAIAVYESLGFRTRKHVAFRGFRVPGD